MTITHLSPTNSSELHSLLTLYQKVFSMEVQSPSAKYFQELLQRPEVQFGIATEGEQIIGGYTIYILPSIYRTQPDIYLYDLAVDTDWQGHGIGKALISHLKTYAKEVSARSIYCSADIDSVQGNEFYQRNDFEKESVNEYRYTL